MFIMQTQNPNLSLPDPFLIRTYFRLAASLHLFHVEESIAEGWPSSQLFSLSTKAQRNLRYLWHFVPKVIRLQCFRVLIMIGKRLYPPSFTGYMHRLPFGIYAKECYRAPRNEGEALRLVEQYTSIPSPLCVDEYQANNPILIMTTVPGQTLDQVYHRLSYPQRAQLSKDLRNILTQLRRIPNQTSHAFGNTHGGPLNDHRLPSGTRGPFDLISEFNAYLIHMCVSDETKEKISKIHARQYRSLFTHADLHPSNIIIDHGRLSGIVDWESSGFYPEYWEFTKIMYGVQGYAAIEPIMRDVFTEDSSYEEELAAEKLLWYDTPFGI
ncbi:unnamed protein product [Penicillium salamii]|uniref:Aminoglycoside phosphotransferase domain-containing protein n=1 Tax=Penicillium salamii TaxID=1612424 RepID=A0A9W4NKT8_9EURO|nr:unnamed protein product [Penicillium salamii]